MKEFLEALTAIFGQPCDIKQVRTLVYRIECRNGESRSRESRNGEKQPQSLYFYLEGAGAQSREEANASLHIDEDLWHREPRKLLARLRVRAGLGRKIHARDTIAARIDKKQALDFQQRHHLQVALPGKYRYGLFREGELVSVAVFSGGRKMRDLPENRRSFELLRFCHKDDLLVVGGLSKLIDLFASEHQPGSLMTYADRDWSDGAAYEQLGFQRRGQTEAQEFWVHRKTLLRTTGDMPPGDDYYRVRNSGSIKLVKSFLDHAPPIVILGPTASGKTSMAVEMARRIGGAILSADSRQVYRGLNIGTGKDLEEYGDVPYFLIDMVEAGERYHIADYLRDAAAALAEIRRRGLIPIICGGTGLYLQGLLQGFPYSDVPTDESLRQSLAEKTLDELRTELADKTIPPDFRPDTSTKKRLIRAIEIAEWTRQNPGYQPPTPLCPNATVYGIAPDRETRRTAISKRLHHRLAQGLLDEVQGLLDAGLSPDQLIYYGLEYKYCTLYLTDQMDRDEFLARLETEIHRYAKRQMTYFRKMEKDGIRIQWLSVVS